MMLRLYVTPHSPWAEIARWSLDIQGIPYVAVATLPVVGSPDLRLRTRRLRGLVAGPVAIKDGEVLSGPFAIARFGSRKSLTPIVTAQQLPAIGRWSERAERMLQAGRILATERVRGDDAALRELLPPPAAKLRRVGGALGRGGATWLLRRARTEAESGDPRAMLRADLDRARDALAAGSGHVVPGGLTYADLALAGALQFIEPVSERYLRLGEANRRAWRDPELADQYGDLIAWRDRLYDAHRESRAPRAPTPVVAQPRA